jgi:hypothetical protein
MELVKSVRKSIPSMGNSFCGVPGVGGSMTRRDCKKTSRHTVGGARCPRPQRLH